MNTFLLNIQQSWHESTTPFRQRWLLLAPREQQLLKILSVFTAILVLVYGIWLPSRHAAQKARGQYASNVELLQSMQANAGDGGSNASATGSVLGVVSSAAAAQGLTLSRIEPEGDAQARVWVERADFNTVATWLATLSTQGIKLQEAQTEKQSDGKGVSARFVLSH